jgi:hypothetical protein
MRRIGDQTVVTVGTALDQDKLAFILENAGNMSKCRLSSSARAAKLRRRARLGAPRANF